MTLSGGLFQMLPFPHLKHLSISQHTPNEDSTMFLHPGQARLSDFAERELDVETRKRTARHLAKCPMCRNAVLSYRRLLAEANHYHYPSHRSPPSPELRARIIHILANHERGSS